MVLKKVFLTGGTGTLGTELIKISREFGIQFVAPSSKTCDIRSFQSVEQQIVSSECDVVLHCAAATDVRDIENFQKSSVSACEINVIGTFNIMKVCEKHNKKLIFISTDHVFDGKKGNYKITDSLNPLTKYAKTKTAAELVTRTYNNSLIIRTSFFGYVFPHPAAFTDQWSSKDYVDLIAPKVLEAVVSNTVGIVHVGGTRRSLYEIAIDRKKNVKATSRQNIDFAGFVSPIDTSLEITNE